MLLVQVIHVSIENILLQTPSFICEIAAFSFVIIFIYDFTISFNEAMDLKEILESMSENNNIITRLEKRVSAVIAFTPIPDIDEIKNIGSNTKEKIRYSIEKLKEHNEERIASVKEHLQLPEFIELTERVEILKTLEKYRKNIMEKSTKQYLRAMKQLKRNPGMKAEKYEEIMDWLKDLLDNH